MKTLNLHTFKKFIFVTLLLSVQCLLAQKHLDTLTSDKEKHANLTVKEFNTLIKGKFILVYLHADWCVICKKQQPILDKVINGENGRLEFLDIDTEANPIINEHFEVDGLPRIILYKKDVIVWQYVGLIQENALRDWVKCF